MIKVLSFIVTVLVTTTLLAQSPERMSYQAIVRDSNNKLVTNQKVGIQISILQGTPTGTVAYNETQTPITNSNGLISIEIGGESGFNTIDWANGPYFIKTETDPTGGTNYSIIATSQLLSVPYALHTKTAEKVSGVITETDPVYTSSVAYGITDTDTACWNRIKNEGMGVWVEQSTDVVYQAESDGFLFGISNETNQCTFHIAHLLTGSSSDDLIEFLQATKDMRFIIPINKGYFYKVIITVDPGCIVQNPSLTLKWIPLF